MSIFTLSTLIGSNVASQTAQSLLRPFANLEPSVFDLAGDENLPPEYFLSNRSAGIQIRHSKDGNIDVVFLFSEGKDDFEEYKGSLCEGVTFASAPNDIRKVFGEPQWSRPPRTIPGLGAVGETWRYELSECNLHFQFRENGFGIDQITLSAKQK